MLCPPCASHPTAADEGQLLERLALRGYRWRKHCERHGYRAATGRWP